MSYTLFYPIPSVLKAAGFGGVSHVPVIFGKNWTYDRIINRYLRERAKGTALPREQRTSVEPTPQSVDTFARWLIDFLEWCLWSKTPWQGVEYQTDLLGGYQRDMKNASWSTTGKSLSPATINNRVSEATYFCEWAARCGYRKEFDVIYQYSNRSAGGGRNSKSHKQVEVKSRAGKVRANPRTLRIPAEAEIEVWLAAIRIKKGCTKALMAKLCVEAGVRREECVQWDLAYLDPDPKKWARYREYVKVTIKYGAKGPKYDDVLKPQRTTARTVGPEREIHIPADLAEELLRYRNSIRSKSLLKYVNAAQDPKERTKRMKEVRNQDRLFVSEYDGQPITGETLRRVFKIDPPWEEWSPHLARHYYTCMRMAHSLRKQLGLRSKPDPEGVIKITAHPDWIVEAGRAEMLMLREQLGHLDEQTTNMYLRWLLQAFGQDVDYIEALEQGPSA